MDWPFLVTDRSVDWLYYVLDFAGRRELLGLIRIDADSGWALPCLGLGDSRG